MSLKIRSESLGDAIVLEVTGEVDMDSSPELRKEIKKALKSKPASLKLRLNDVPYIDSSGIAVLLEGMIWSNKQDVAYVLLDLNERVSTILFKCRLLKRFDVQSTDS